jgi:hypothetical protein
MHLFYVLCVPHAHSSHRTCVDHYDKRFVRVAKISIGQLRKVTYPMSLTGSSNICNLNKLQINFRSCHWDP